MKNITTQHYLKFVEALKDYPVKKTKSGCLNWQGWKNPKGYGCISRRIEGKLVRIYAHRIVMATLIGENFLYSGLLACHSCDNPSCINPKHLFVGTHRDNTLDMIKKKRHNPWDRRGEVNPKARLTEKQVIKIRKIYKPRVLTHTKLAKMFKVSKECIQELLSRKRWKHI